MMLSKFLAVLSCLIFLPLGSLFAFYHPEQGMKGFYERKFETPESFEKIYVNSNSIVYLPHGIYLRHSCGELEKVRCVSHDYKGSYVLRIHTQCSKCGRVYPGKESPEGWSCMNLE